MPNCAQLSQVGQGLLRPLWTKLTRLIDSGVTLRIRVRPKNSYTSKVKCSGSCFIGLHGKHARVLIFNKRSANFCFYNRMHFGCLNNVL